MRGTVDFLSCGYEYMALCLNAVPPPLALLGFVSLPPLLYTLCTNDCISQHEDRHVLKFADDTVIIHLLHHDESQLGPVVDEFVRWCDEAFLQGPRTRWLILGGYPTHHLRLSSEELALDLMNSANNMEQSSMMT